MSTLLHFCRRCGPRWWLVPRRTSGPGGISHEADRGKCLQQSPQRRRLHGGTTVSGHEKLPEEELQPGPLGQDELQAVIIPGEQV